jgi:hypothetical protein
MAMAIAQKKTFQQGDQRNADFLKTQFRAMIVLLR